MTKWNAEEQRELAVCHYNRSAYERRLQRFRKNPKYRKQRILWRKAIREMNARIAAVRLAHEY